MSVRNNKLTPATNYIDGEVFFAEDHNDTNDAIIDYLPFYIAHAQQSFQQLQATSFVNQDSLGAELFSTAAGKNLTINTLDSTTLFRANFREIDRGVNNHTLTGDGFNTLTNIYGFNDGSSSTGSTSGSSGTPFTKHAGLLFDSSLIKTVRLKCMISASNYGTLTYYRLKLQTYNGSTWSDEATLINLTGNGTETYDDVYDLNKTVQGVRILIEISAGSFSLSWSCHYLEPNSNLKNGTVVTSDMNDLSGTERAIVVYTRSVIPTDTNITVDVLRDSTVVLSEQQLNKVIDISADTTPGKLRLIFNLNSTPGSPISPIFYGFGFYLIN